MSSLQGISNNRRDRNEPNQHGMTSVKELNGWSIHLWAKHTKLWYKLGNLLRKTGVSPAMSWLVMWESHLDYANAFWCKIWTCNGYCQICGLLADEQKQNWVNVWQDFQMTLQGYLQFLFRVIRGVITWVCGYNSKTKNVLIMEIQHRCTQRETEQILSPLWR